MLSDERSFQHMTVTMTDRVPEGIRTQIAAGHPILVALRNSGHGLSNKQGAADDSVENVKGLAHAGIDVSKVMPTTDEILEALASKDAWQVDSVAIDGKPFHNRFVVIDRRQLGLVVLVSSGSVSKLATATRSQPFLDAVTKVVDDTLPCLLWVKIDDRLSRVGLAMAPLLSAVKWNREAGHVNMFYGNSSDGIQPDGGAFADVMKIIKGEEAGNQARAFGRRGRERMVEKTGGRMEAGRVTYATYQSVPPGFARVKLSGVKGGSPGLMYAECGLSRPNPADVAEHFPKVRDSQGQPVDQVDNVRFILAHVGRPGWGRKELAAEAALRNFSTDGMRACTGLDAHCGNQGPSSALNAIDAVLENLDFYESGQLTRSVGQKGVGAIVIESCFPPDGRPWATPEDFSRIRVSEAERAARARPHVATFSGLSVSVNGRSARLWRYFKREREALLDTTGKDSPPVEQGGVETLGRPVLFRFAYPDGCGQEEASGWFSHDAFSASIGDGLACAGDVPLDRFIFADDENPETSVAAAALNRAQQELDSLLATQAKRVKVAEELGSDQGGALLAQLNRKFQEAEETTIPAARSALAAAKARVIAQRRIAEEAAASRRNGIPTANLLSVLATLRNPTAGPERAEWHRALRDVRFEVQHLTRAGRKGRRLSWSGLLLLTAPGDVTVAVPFSGEQYTGAMFTVEERFQAHINALRDGIPYLAHKNCVAAEDDVSRLLGHDQGRYPILRVLAPPLLRLCMRVLYPTDGQPVDVKKLLDEPDLVFEHGRPDLLAQRILAFDAAREVNALWCRQAPRTFLVTQLVRASDDGLLPAPVSGRLWMRLMESQAASAFTRDSSGNVRLAPCGFCGSFRRSPLNVRLAEGLVCLDCRVDTTGVRWLADVYDRWIPSPELWAAKNWTPTATPTLNPGRHADVVGGPLGTQGKGRPRGAKTGTTAAGYRLASELNVEEVATAIKRYKNKDGRVEDIKDALQLADNEWRRLLRANGSPRRNPRPNART